VTGALSIVAAILAVSLLIIVHELGHYLAARAVGMRVERFSIGFGPVLLSFRRGDTLFALSAIPVGGYVSVAGTTAGAAVSADDRGAYANKAAWQRFAFVLAGPVMNYLSAILVAWALLGSVGLGVADPAARVGSVVPGMPAAEAGLRPGDRIEAVAGTPVSSWQELVQEVQRHPGEEIPLAVAREDGPGGRLELRITPRDVGGVGRVGLAPAELTVRTGGLEAIPAAIRLTNANLSAQLAAFANLFTRKQKAELSGPIGIAQELVRGARAGMERFLKLVWTISVGLAVLNLLPFPALDGSRLLFLGYELVTRRRVNERVEGLIHAGGFVVLLILILAVSFGDVARLLR
jgi:regulator of sigma E protease